MAGVSAYLSSLEDPFGLAVEVEVSPKSPPQDVSTNAKLPGIQSGKVPNPVEQDGGSMEQRGSCYNTRYTEEDSSSGLNSLYIQCPWGMTSLMDHMISIHSPKAPPIESRGENDVAEFRGKVE